AQESSQLRSSFLKKHQSGSQNVRAHPDVQSVNFVRFERGGSPGGPRRPPAVSGGRFEFRALMMSTVEIRTEKTLYEFGGFRVDPVRRRLMRGGEQVPLTPKAFSILLVLLEKRGEVVEK